MGSQLFIRLLGRFEIIDAAGYSPLIEAARVRALLSYLLLQPGCRAARTRIAFQFWPDSSEAQAQTNLRKLLHTLYHSFPAARTWLTEGGGNLQWRVDGAALVDVHSFEETLRQAGAARVQGDRLAQRQHLQRAVALYEGDLLPDCYDDWAMLDRERLRELYLAALQELVLLLEGEGELTTALAYGRRLLRHDPLREASYRTMMRLYGLDGDLAALSQTYHLLAATLRRELQLDPAPASQELYQRLISGTARLCSVLDTGAAELPLALPPTSFVGRAGELAMLLDLLCDPDLRLITLCGPPGVGKTRLALEAVALLEADRRTSMLLLALAELRGPADLFAALAGALGLTPDDPQRIGPRLQHALNARPLLLVLDNFEHLLAAAATLPALLAACPRLKLLVTSRAPLRLRGERELRLQPLALPAHDKQADLALECSSFGLLVDRARAARLDFPLSPASATPLVELCRRLDGLPLAIELAALRLKRHSPAALLARMERPLRLLVDGPRDLPPRQQSLRRAIAWSYDLLDPGDQKLFRQVAVFEGPWRVEDALASCPGVDLAADEVADRLDALVEQGLLCREDSAGDSEAGYSMLGLLRAFALEQLIEHLEYDAALERLLRYQRAAQPQLLWDSRLVWSSR